MDIETLQREIEELRDSIGAVSSAIKTHDHDGDNSSYLVDLIKANQSYSITNIHDLSAGTGTANEKFTFKSKQGLWMGNESFASAPFSVDMEGNLTSNSLTVTNGTGANSFHIDKDGNMWWGNYATWALAEAALALNISKAGVARLTGAIISGYILVGGAAADVNAASTEIQPGKILISGSTSLDDWRSGSDATMIDGGDIYTNSVTAAKLAADVISGGKIIAGLLTATNITTGTLNASNVTITNLTATHIQSGDFTIGGTSQPGNIKIIESTAGGAGSTTAKLYWQSTGGTLRGKIWTDGSGYMGYNAMGARHYFYCNDYETMVLDYNVQAIFNYGISCRKNFNVTSGNTARFENKVYMYGSSTTEYFEGGSDMLTYYAKAYHYFNVNSTEMLKISAQGVQNTNGILYLSQLASATGGGYTSQNGAIYYDSNAHKFMGRKNGSWVEITTT